MNPQDITIMSEGNIGAVMFLAQLLKPERATQAHIINQFLQHNPTVRGTQLYTLFSDLGDRDYAKVVALIQRVPTGVLVYACSKEDRSGVKLVAPHLVGTPW